MRLQKTSSLLSTMSGLVLACGAVVLLVSLLTHFFHAAMGHDQSSYLMEAQHFLAGNQIYGEHLSETNPPLIIWFSAIPVLLAQWIHGSPVLLLKLLVLAMLLVSVAWCLRILRRNPIFTNPLSFALLGLAILYTECSIGEYDFGQREHLLVILLFPYVLAVATGVVSRLGLAERCALGIAAALAFWFKPHDIVLLVVLELFLAIRARSLRRIFKPEFLSLVLTCLLMLVFVRFFTPLYFTKTYPLLLDTYWGLGTHNALPLALTLHRYMAAFFCVALIWVLLRKSLHDPETSLTLLICSFAASIAFDLQHTDWEYHGFPHRAFLWLAFLYLLVDALDRFNAKFISAAPLVRKTMLVASAATIAFLCAVAVRPELIYPPIKQPDPELHDFLAQYQPSTTVYVFSTSVSALSASYNLGLNWGSRFAHLWMLPAILQNELGPPGPHTPFKRLSPQRVAELSALQRSQSTEDLKYWHPAVVLVQRCTLEYPCQGIDKKNVDVLSWFLQSPQFAEEWSHYQQQPGFDHFDVYKAVP